LSAGIIAAVTGIFSGSPPARVAAPRSAGPLQVHNPPVGAEVVADAARQSKSSMPLVDVLLHNTGTRRTVISQARFVVRGFGRLSDCRPPAVGARLTESARYDVLLPVSPRVGASVSASVSQELAPDEADRFGFRFGNAASNPDDPGAYVYLLDVQLLHDNIGAPLDLGDVLLALPGTPAADVVGAAPENGKGCVTRNYDLLRHLSTLRPVMSAEMRALLQRAVG
jgi:hypothetical protein